MLIRSERWIHLIHNCRCISFIAYITSQDGLHHKTAIKSVIVGAVLTFKLCRRVNPIKILRPWKWSMFNLSKSSKVWSEVSLRGKPTWRKLPLRGGRRCWPICPLGPRCQTPTKKYLCLKQLQTSSRNKFLQFLHQNSWHVKEQHFYQWNKMYSYSNQIYQSCIFGFRE